MPADPSRVPSHKRKSHGATRVVKSTKAVAKAKAVTKMGKVGQVAGANHWNSNLISYSATHGVDAFVKRISEATPMQLVEVERHGVNGRFIKDFSERIGISSGRLCEILGVPKATVEKLSAEGTEISGAAGQAAIAVAQLLAKAQVIVRNSTSPLARDFDVAMWLGQWIDRPQPALGGRKPAELLSTPTGAVMVSRLLGAIESGAYQ